MLRRFVFQRSVESKFFKKMSGTLIGNWESAWAIVKVTVRAFVWCIKRPKIWSWRDVTTFRVFLMRRQEHVFKNLSGNSIGNRESACAIVKFTSRAFVWCIKIAKRWSWRGVLHQKRSGRKPRTTTPKTPSVQASGESPEVLWIFYSRKRPRMLGN